MGPHLRLRNALALVGATAAAVWSSPLWSFRYPYPCRFCARSLLRQHKRASPVPRWVKAWPKRSSVLALGAAVLAVVSTAISMVVAAEAVATTVATALAAEAVVEVAAVARPGGDVGR